MNVWYIATGTLIIIAMLGGMMMLMAHISGWKVAGGVMAFALTMTALAVGAATLISYGIGY